MNYIILSITTWIECNVFCVATFSSNVGNEQTTENKYHHHIISYNVKRDKQTSVYLNIGEKAVSNTLS